MPAPPDDPSVEIGSADVDDEGAVKPVDLSRPCINRGEAIAVFFWGGNREEGPHTQPQRHHQVTYDRTANLSQT